MRFRMKLLPAAVGTLGMLLCAGPVPAQTAVQGIPGTRRSPAGWPAVAEKTGRDAAAITADILAMVYYANETKIEMGQLALSRGASAQVRRYGALVVADHERMDRALLRYAKTRRGITVETTSLAGDERPEMQEKAQAIQRMRTLSGAAFDRELLAAIVPDQQRAIADMESYRLMVDDPDLRELFSKILPILMQHVTIAAKLESKGHVEFLAAEPNAAASIVKEGAPAK